jgi:hypothetical protein
MLVMVEVRALALVDADAPSSTEKSAMAIVFGSIVVSPAICDLSPATSAQPQLWLHACGLPRGEGGVGGLWMRGGYGSHCRSVFPLSRLAVFHETTDAPDPTRYGPVMTTNATPFIHHTPVTVPDYTQHAMSNPRSPESPTLRQRALSALQRARRAIRGLRADVSSPPLQWQIDWDNDVPPFPIFAGEVARAIGDAQRHSQADRGEFVRQTTQE